MNHCLTFSCHWSTIYFSFATAIAATAVAATGVANMKFYGRNEEIKRLHKEFEKTELHSTIIVLTGRRRIGKTRLIFEAHKDKPSLYFFVGKKKIADLLKEWTTEMAAKIGGVHGEFKDFSQFLDFLFHRAKEEKITVFFDEVQNFLSVYPGAFSDLQKYFDINRETSSLLLIFAGSSYSMLEKIFTGGAEPLFGRASEFIRLSYLPIHTQKEILKDGGLYSGENLLHMFSVFDGVPRFYEEMLETGEKSFKGALHDLIVSKEFLWDEGINMMREEFGKDYAIYHSILAAIAVGKRSRNEIEQAMNGSAGGYLKNLEDIYRMIRREKPVLSRTARGGVQRYYPADHFFEFWFRFMSRFQALREINRKDTAFEKIWGLLPEYEGYKFEALVKRIFIEMNPFDIEFTVVGRHWDRTGENEIDLVFLEEDSRTAFVVEAKRNLKKCLKKEEKIKLYTKVGTIRALQPYDVHYFFAGIEDGEIVIVDEKDHKFVL